MRLASELTGWKIDLYSSREWLERGGEGPLAAAAGRGDCLAGAAQRAPGVVSELTGILESAGYKMLNDILDLEREDIAKIPGMSPEAADQLMAFLAELTDEEAAKRPSAPGDDRAPGPDRPGIPRPQRDDRRRRGTEDLQAGKCWCVVVAEDASPRTMDKVVRLAAAKEVPLLPGLRAAAIGASWEAAGDGGGCAGPRLASGMVHLASARS